MRRVSTRTSFAASRGAQNTQTDAVARARIRPQEAEVGVDREIHWPLAVCLRGVVR